MREAWKKKKVGIKLTYIKLIIKHNKMKYNNKEDSVFNTHIRIKKEHLEWLRKHKTTKTMAGFLDIIINKYRNEKNRI